MVSEGIKAQDPGEILKLAEMLRAHVSETADMRYASLFKQTADALESRARELARPSTSSGAADVIC